MTPDIIYEDPDIIVCVKPAGTPTQSNNFKTPDMVSILKNTIYRSTNKEPYLAVIHRLDQPVEGLLVFAKTPAAARNLNRQMTESGFGKHYLALLHGTPAPMEGILTDYLVKDGRTNMSRVCTPDTPGAKKAILRYKIRNAHFPDEASPYSLAEITLETGRHHQIRVQTSHLGCPIAGDQKYGGSPYMPQSKDLVLHQYSTLQLYACRLTFRHPRTGKRMEFKLRNVLETLEGSLDEPSIS